MNFAHAAAMVDAGV